MTVSTRSSRFGPRAAATASFVLLLFVLVQPLFAAVHTVTDFGDSGAPGQLRTLMNAAAPGDTIVIPPGTIVLTGVPAEDGNASGDLDITKNLTIVGAGADLTVVDGGGVDRIFQVPVAVTAALSGMTLRNGSVDPAAPFDPSGGGVLNRGTLSLTAVVVENNFAGGGGGIANFAGTITLTGSTVRNNSSTGVTANGGGISNFADMYIYSSTISANVVFGPSASTLGGGIISLGNLIVINSTVSGNKASGNFGGGIYITPGALFLKLNNVTIADNEAFLGGGGLAVTGGATDIANTILSDNRVSGAGSSPDCLGTIVSGGYNLVADPSGCTIAGSTTGNQLGRRARLFPLADNGGPTWTHALRRSSGAIDGGDNLQCFSQDQRGEVRPLDGDRNGTAICDIGAYELRR